MVYKINRNLGDKTKDLSQVSGLLVQSLKEFRNSDLLQLSEAHKQITLVGILPQPHQIITRKINFEPGKMLASISQYFF